MAASEPEVSEDGTTYTITLRDGLMWSDGDPLTAEDFEYGIKRTCNPIHAGNYQYVLVNIIGCDAHYTNEAGFDQALEDAIGVNAVDDTTLEIKLQNPQPTFPIILSLWMTFPAPIHKFSGATSDPWPDGTDPSALAFNGPYIYTEYVSADHITLEPNPNWAAPQDVSPTLDTITLRLIDDPSVAVNAFRTEELDFADVDVTQLETLVSEFGEGEEYFKNPLPSTRGLQFNLADPALSNLNLRLALGRAIDRAEVVELVTQNANDPTTSWIPEVTSGEAPGKFDDILSYDEAAAKELYDAAVAELGGPPTLSITLGDSAVQRSIGEVLQQQFQEVFGFELTLDVVDAQTRSSRFTNEQFQLFWGGWIEDYPDMENWVDGQFNTTGSLNHFNCSLPDLDSTIDAARYNTNEEERLSQWREAEEIIINNVCGIAPVWVENNHYLINSRIVGMSENMTGQDAFSAGDWAIEHWGIRAE
jgi:oligopeptide transport system substrate-binding protein